MSAPVYKRVVAFIAAGFGLGYSPIAPGTVGSLWGIVIVFGLHALGLSLTGYIVACVLLALLAIPVCHVADQVYVKKDDGRIVADEFLTFPICLIGLPVAPEYGWLLVVAFCSNRFFDILKIPPARQLESLPGGAGIALDDVAASLYSLAANWAVFWVITRFL